MSHVTQPIASRIESAVRDIPGWSPLDQLQCLFTLAFSSAHLQGDILELGSWCGRSAIVLGMAAQATGKVKVHCVDLFPEKNDWFRNADGTYSFSVQLNGVTFGAYQDQTVWEEPFLRDIAPLYERWPGTLEAFNDSVRKHNLEGCVIPYRADLESFVRNVAPDFCLSLAFIDGDHGFHAVCKDIETVEPFLLSGGWICFDDAFSSYNGVNDAIRDMVIHSGKYERFQQMTRKLFVAQKL
ncbi:MULTISPECIES: class I SAM-dependent methyltransferase [unclassified Haematospirillum]|uniref:class I SAM-dependent methyltransferase n=1 Tax=unclassified Haematospirillum TaxID=2622088 RepID=UPI00143C3098|nr:MULTISPECIES: class I SAM-dependent methyltransferase [unclassified Haematospirillum]NKD55220.1 class I SAM-dependent methyltransferase [Haematospirillum sp. H4890]NKD75105.1 class I SAM-dependent methyltransferase [Haematospirillum sp. H4485]